MIGRNFAGRAAAANGPVGAFRAVTPNDADDLPDGDTRGLFVGQAGSLMIVGGDGAEVTLHSAASQYHPLPVRRVRATGTTATDIIALY